MTASASASAATAPAPTEDADGRAEALSTPFAMIGGAPVVAAIVGRFYDLMDSDPAYAALRAMHAADLRPMRDSLAGFLTAWLGGPRDRFAARPGACVMSLHGPLAIDDAAAEQWAAAMHRAIAADPAIPPALAAAMGSRLGGMARAMVNRPD